jgi:TonB-dependent starch-binding outer membrane protein SusC
MLMSMKRLLHVIFMPILLLCSLSLLAQDRVVTGKVTDSKDGSPVAGASVQPKGSTTGTSTSTDGRFSVSVPSGVNTLVISSAEFERQEIDITGKSSVDVAMTATAGGLSEVVVIGYGTARKKDLTGAVTTVQAKDFNKGVFTSPDNLIQGKVAGVQIINNSGQPGGAATIKIRGNSAVTGTGSPLFVIDGVPLDGRTARPGVGDLGFGDGNPASNPLNFTNPSDIASMDVLKDASATAIYGSRAAYGVVLITTKKGQTGPPKVDFNASVGFSKIMRRIETLDAAQYREAINYYQASPSNDKGGDVDAIDEITQTGVVQNYSVGMSGGTDNAKYRISVSALDQEGIVIKTGFRKYTAYLGAQFKFLESKKLGLDISILPSQFIEEIAPISSNAGADGSMIGQALQWNPTLPLRVKRANGTDSIVNVGGTSIVNPVGISAAYDDRAKVTTILGSISPYFKITSWLEYRMLYSINYSSGVRRTSFKPDINVAFTQNKGYAQIGQNELTTQQITHTLNLNKEIAPDLNLNAVVGYEYLKYVNKGYTLGAFGIESVGGFGNFGLDYTNYLQYGNPSNRIIGSFMDPDYEIQSYFARAAFNYRDKYLLTGTFRSDGSTKFGENNRYGYFPSFAAGWIISKEDFFNVPFINSMKIRGGWGKTGNQEFPSGAAQGRYGLNSIDATSVRLNRLNNPNPDLKWQSDRQYNIGADISLLKNKLTVTIDYFNKRTTDLLFPTVPVQPAAPGAPIKWVNIPGNIDNQGVELTAFATVINQSDMSWEVGVNATFLKNEVSGLSAGIATGSLNGQGSTGAHRFNVLPTGNP